jgi:hypothetical protein
LHLELHSAPLSNSRWEKEEEKSIKISSLKGKLGYVMLKIKSCAKTIKPFVYLQK